MTPPPQRLAAITLHLQVRKHERAGVTFTRACRLVADAAGTDAFTVRAAVIRYRESLGGPAAPGLTASEYAEILTSANIVDAILDAFNVDGGT